MADTTLTVKPEDDGSVLTEEAQRRLKEYRANYDTAVHDPNRFCVPHGMPWIMVSRARDYLIDIYQTRDRITMLFEGMDVHRLIRLDQKAVPEGYSPGTNGYSLGHWEGATLVIETSHLRAASDVGPLQRSEQMRVTERWRMVRHEKHGEALEVQLSAADPVVYRSPGRGYQLFVRAPAGSVLNAYGCNESLWDDHVAEWRKAHAQRQ